MSRCKLCSSTRYSRCKQKEKNVEAAFLTSTPNVFYMTNFHCEPHERLLGMFVFQEKEPI
ncbi:aminopeptidase P family N-terminal domain-containing protein, partial [Bacillus cereus]